MAKVIHKGLDENGLIKAEIKSTAILVTELIEKFPDMCEYEIYKALCEIRESAESDASIRRTYLKSLKREKSNEEEK